MGRACSMVGGGRGEVHTAFGWRNLMERDHMEEIGVDGMIILKCIFKMWNGGGMD